VPFLGKIRSEHDAADLVCIFDKQYGIACKKRRRKAFARRLFLHSATLYNHISLVTLLVRDLSYDLDSCANLHRRPLVTAMQEENLELVKIFLSAGSSMFVQTGYSRHLPNSKISLSDISAVEYACTQLPICSQGFNGA